MRLPPLAAVLLALSSPAALADDDDNDGVDEDRDCDDHDPLVHPFADERCNGEDDDCDEDVDEDAIDAVTYWADRDGDGWGDSADEVQACDTPDGYVEVSGDCDDDAVTIHPAAVETCNGLDDDCSGAPDEGVCETGDTGAPTGGPGGTTDSGDAGDTDVPDGPEPGTPPAPPDGSPDRSAAPEDAGPAVAITPGCACSGAGAPAGWGGALALALVLTARGRRRP